MACSWEGPHLSSTVPMGSDVVRSPDNSAVISRNQVADAICTDWGVRPIIMILIAQVAPSPASTRVRPSCGVCGSCG